MSLRGRLTLLTAAVFAVCLVIVAVAVPRLVRGSLMDRLDGDLADTRQMAATSLGDNIGFPSAPGRDRHSPLSNAAYAEVREADGTLIRAQFLDGRTDGGRGPDLAGGLGAADGEPFTVGSLDGDDGSWRVAVYPIVIETRSFGSTAVSERDGILVVALPTSEVDATTNSVVRIVWVTSAISVGALLGLGWLFVGLGLRPLRRMERSAAAISGADDLGLRVDHPSERTELGRLGTTINGMLGRLEASFSEQQATEARLRRFAADASHELRTPLTSIRGYAELYRRGGDDPEQVARSMGRIEHEAARMGSLVDDLLLLARVDADLPLDRQMVALHTIVEGLAADARVVDPDREITVSAESCTVVGDRLRLTQAVANVLTNARVHTPAGTPIELTVRALPPPLPGPGGAQRAEIAVVDHGRGLEPDQLARVFERFYRVDEARTRERGGSGLGLSITAAIVAAHGGETAARATPGGGATFVLTIPVDGPPACAAADAAQGGGTPA